MPWGLQTHIYAPAGVDLRQKWQIRGNQPGEPAEPRELGSNAPSDGLYLREDVEITCNITMVPFVKGQNKKASAILVERLVRKAELLDSGVLHAMFENGKLKSVNPAVRASMAMGSVYAPPMSPQFPAQSSSHRLSRASGRSDTSPTDSFNSFQQSAPYHVIRQQQQDDERKRQSMQNGFSPPQDENSPYNQQGRWQQQQHQYPQYPQYQQQHLNAHGRQPSQGQYSNNMNSGLAIEMPGDTCHPPQYQQAGQKWLQQGQDHHSHYSELSGASPALTSSRSGMGSDRTSSHASNSSRPSSLATQSVGTGHLQTPEFNNPPKAHGDKTYSSGLPAQQ